MIGSSMLTKNGGQGKSRVLPKLYEISQEEAITSKWKFIGFSQEKWGGGCC